MYAAYEFTLKIYTENLQVTDFSTDEKKEIIQDCHNATSENKTIEEVKILARWKTLEKDVINYLRKWDWYQRYKLIKIRVKEQAIVTDIPSESNV